MDTGVRVTDEEFMRLIGTTTLTFAAQMRAEAIAYDLRNRMAQVAADLRNAVDSGQARRPASRSVSPANSNGSRSALTPAAPIRLHGPAFPNARGRWYRSHGSQPSSRSSGPRWDSWLRDALPNRVDRFAYLDRAEGPHGTLAFVERETRFVPLETAMGDDTPSARLEIGDQDLHTAFRASAGRQHAPPMFHQRRIGAMIAAQFARS